MNRSPPWLSRLSLVLLVLIGFPCLFRAEFVEWDDPSTIARNTAFNPPTWNAILGYWSHAEMSLCIPLTYTLWGALAAIAHVSQSNASGFTLNPLIFHAANIAVH